MNKKLPTIGEAIGEALDPKLQRIHHNPQAPKFVHCFGCRHKGRRHSYKCPSATNDDLRYHCDMLETRAEWAQSKATTWLQAVRSMHGKLAMLKAEMKTIRTRNQA